MRGTHDKPAHRTNLIDSSYRGCCLADAHFIMQAEALACNQPIGAVFLILEKRE
jgi:hypothetical protein